MRSDRNKLCNISHSRGKLWNLSYKILYCHYYHNARLQCHWNKSIRASVRETYVVQKNAGGVLYVLSGIAQYRILKNLVHVTLVFNWNRVFTFILYRRFQYDTAFISDTIMLVPMLRQGRAQSDQIIRNWKLWQELQDIQLIKFNIN